MPSAVSVLKARAITACRVAAVATQAGVAPATWASTSIPRVFAGLAGMLGGRNRGRLPFLEVEISSQDMGLLAQEGGTLTQAVTVRCHVGDVDIGAAGDLAAAILGAAATAIRDQSSDALTVLGGDQVGELQPGPWGLMRDLIVTVEQSYSRADYGVT